MNIVFDTETLLAFYLGEPAGKNVERRLVETMKGEIKSYLNIVNLTELYYILYRKNPEIAEEKERNLRGYGVEIVPVKDNELWREAAKTKGKHALSLADAFAVATAKVKNATLLVGQDPEFDGLDISIERIS
ncbi:MAG: type II toxin-antitoxin system VapC family toxin [Chloroflexi bacterium]|nr:type II toxin-antitoxin system VapC family toxin [Chloroflexota bacterium]